MTRPEAEKELAELEPRAAFVWENYLTMAQTKQDAIRLAKEAYDASHLLFETELRQLRNDWLPLKQRQDQLKAFLEVA